METGKETYTLEGHKSFITAIATTPDERYAISGSYDNTLKVWDLKTGKETYTLEGHKSHVYTVAITPDGTLCCFWIR